MSLTGHVLGPRDPGVPGSNPASHRCPWPAMSLAPGGAAFHIWAMGSHPCLWPVMSLVVDTPGRQVSARNAPALRSPAPADYPGCASVPPAPYTTRSIHHMLCRTIPMRLPCGRDARILEGTLRRTTALVPRPRRLQLRPAAVRSAFSWERGPLARNGPKARGCPCLFPAKAQKPAVAHAGKMPALPGQPAPAQNWRTKRTSPRRRS